ncbi:cell division cycle 7-related protein kinase-like [Centruroides sculpturatus]|nr:cell division cycle 7-related protein kinase-like [Centruroides sculpturatus]
MKSPSKKRQVMHDVSNTFLPLSQVMQEVGNNQLSQLCSLQDTKKFQTHPKLNRTLFVHSFDSKTTKMNCSKTNDMVKNRCSCYGKQEVCKICLNRPPEIAPRAGTPGFRAPEVLLKYQSQTTAVDMWAAGVIFLSLLTKKYPFFRASDDLSSLAEITCIVGSKRLQQAALSIGKRVFLSIQKPKVDFKLLCQRIQSIQRNSENVPNEPENTIPESAYNLLGRLLDPNPLTRITAQQACAHQFITTTN